MAFLFEQTLGEAFDNFRVPRREYLVEKYAAAEAGRSMTASMPVAYDAQKTQTNLRPLYGKGGPVIPSIGDHPDFRELKGTSNTALCPITTMFMDIESSTRLALLYPLETVQEIKNSFIKAAIQVIKTFDGHVHRIMGDAVMAYFGGKNGLPEDSIVDGLNAAAVLQLFAATIVNERLRDVYGFESDFGVRIGVDYGPREKVLWSSYGYPQMDEVTATSFHVDVASKLQHSAGRNQVMVGGSLIETMDFPDDLLSVKTVRRDGVEVPQPFLLPNLTRKDGTPINYPQRILNVEKYLLHSPMAWNSGHLFQTQPFAPLPVDITVHSGEKGPLLRPYFPTASALEKSVWLKFVPRFPFTPSVPYQVDIKIENHGKEALEKGGETRDYHEKTHDVFTHQEHWDFGHWERTAYRGLHYVTIDIDDKKGSRYRSRLGIFIQ